MVKSSIPGIPQIERRLCCCFSVETGSLIIGTLGLIISLIALLGIPAILTKSRVLPIIFDFDNYWFLLIVTLYIVSILSVYSNLTLIKGILERQPKLMFPWIYSGYIGLIILALLFVGVIITLLSSIVAQTHEVNNNEIIAIIISILFLGFGYYFFGVVVSHCQDVIFIQENDLDRYIKPYSLNYDLHNY